MNIFFKNIILFYGIYGVSALLMNPKRTLNLNRKMPMTNLMMMRRMRRMMKNLKIIFFSSIPALLVMNSVYFIFYLIIFHYLIYQIFIRSEPDFIVDLFINSLLLTWPGPSNLAHLRCLAYLQ